MINKISFKNYKAFTEGQIKIKPITILLGANSVGKSSIMQLFLLLQQTAQSEKNYKSAIKLHGGFVSLGEGLNLIRKKDISKVLTIDLEFENNHFYKQIIEDYFVNFCKGVLYFAAILHLKYKKSNDYSKIPLLKHFLKSTKNDLEISLKILRISNFDTYKKFNKRSFKNLVNYINSLIKDFNINDLPEDITNDFIFFRTFGTNIFGNKSIVKYFYDDIEELLQTYNFLIGISESLKNGIFNVSYEIVILEKILVIKKISIHNESNLILSIEFKTVKSNKINLKSIKSKYLTKNITSRILQNVNEIFIFPSTIFSFTSELYDFEIRDKHLSPLANTLHYFFKKLNDIVSNNFKNDNINYVSPLRAHPKRYYFLDKAKRNAYVDTLDGDAIAETLKENELLKILVNNWLSKFQLNVNVEHLEDIIHKLQVNQNSLNLDITDVGFGISQVLPVIIQGFLSHNESLTLIEQPEIHLHPKMQADLADLFIDIVSNKNSGQKNQKSSKLLLIETHSEYLLKRLRRRISDGTIQADSVAIYLIDPDINNKGAILRELNIGERGQFEWPIDFYGGELLNDTIEFIKNQNKTDL